MGFLSPTVHVKWFIFGTHIEIITDYSKAQTISWLCALVMVEWPLKENIRIGFLSLTVHVRWFIFGIHIDLIKDYSKQ